MISVSATLSVKESIGAVTIGKRQRWWRATPLPGLVVRAGLIRDMIRMSIAAHTG